MKCPKCGKVSYAGLTRCRACGSRLAPAAGQAPSISDLLFRALPGPRSKDQGAKAIDLRSSKIERPSIMPVPKGSRGEELRNMPDDIEFTPIQRAQEDSSSEDDAAMPWRRELSDRVQDFRRKRARLRNEPENLDFDFGETAEPEGPPLLEFSPKVRVESPDVTSPMVTEQQQGEHHLEEETLDRVGADEALIDAATTREGESVLQPLAPADHRLEIVVGPAESDVQPVVAETHLETFSLAPIGQRFLAGLMDGLVLLVGCGLFALIFRVAGGHLTPGPLNLAIAMLIGAVFIVAYFGLFTTLTFSTPGLIRMGIEVRNMEGCPPTLQESFLRAFGYMVSASALMIGFLWALVDGEGLTWHDRISGTFLTPVGSRPVAEVREGSLENSAREL